MAILKKIFSAGATDLVNSVGNAIDKIHTSAEEKELVKAEINKQIQEFEHNIQKEVTKRWESDNAQSSWLPRNIRPLSLAFLLLVLTIFTLIDFGYTDLQLNSSMVDLWSMLAITAFGAYFGGRSYEKIKNAE